MTLPMWFFSPWPLFVCLGILFVFKVRRPYATTGYSYEPLGRWDLLWAVFSGLAVVVLASEVLSQSYLIDFGVTTPDLEEFCETVHGLRGRSPRWVARQPGAGLLPAWLSLSFGFMDGLTLGALISSFVIGAAHYLGGRILLGPLAGVASALLGLTLAPLVVLTRHMTFYPEATAGFLLCVVGGIYLLRVPHLRGLFVAGLGVALALLVDFVGLLLAAPVVLLAGVVVLRTPGWRKRSLALCLFFTPIILSFTLAGVYTPRSMSGFEEEIQFYVKDVDGFLPLLGPELLLDEGHSAGVNSTIPTQRTGDAWIYHLPLKIRAKLPSLHNSFMGKSYIWGHTMPWELPTVFLRVALFSTSQQRREMEFTHGEHSVYQDRNADVYPLLPLLIAGFLVTLFALRKKPWLILGLILIILPFGLSLRYQTMTRVLPRFLMAPLVPFPIFMGIFFSYLTTWGKCESGKGRIVGPVLIGLLLLVIVGVVPSYLSPKAPWRGEVATINAPLLRLKPLSEVWKNTPPQKNRPMQSCEPVFRMDYLKGRNPWGTLRKLEGYKGEPTADDVVDDLTIQTLFRYIPSPKN